MTRGPYCVHAPLPMKMVWLAYHARSAAGSLLKMAACGGGESGMNAACEGKPREGVMPMEGW